MLRLEPAALRAHLEGRERSRVVDEDVRRGEVGVRLGQPRPVLLLQVSRAQAMRVDPRVRAEHAEHELLLRHLEREDADRVARLERRVLRNVQAERRLPHGGAGGQDDEVALLQAARLLVEVDETGGQPGDEVLRLRELVDGAEALLDDLADAHEALADAVLGDVEDRLLGAVEEDGRFLLTLEAGLHDAVARVDQVPEDRLLLDDPAPLLDARDARQPVQEARQVGRSAHRLEGGAPAELVLQGDEVDGLTALGEGGHGVEDPTVGLAVEVLAGQDLGRGVEGRVVHEHGAQDGPLRLGVLRERLVLGNDLGRHEAAPVYCVAGAAAAVPSPSSWTSQASRSSATLGRLMEWSVFS